MVLKAGGALEVYLQKIWEVSGRFEVEAVGLSLERVEVAGINQGADAAIENFFLCEVHQIKLNTIMTQLNKKNVRDRIQEKKKVILPQRIDLLLHKLTT